MSADAAGPERATSAYLAVSATFTADLLVEPLQLVLDRIDLPLAVEITPYGQVFQELLDPTRRFANNRGGVNVLLVRLEDWWSTTNGESRAALSAAEAARPVEDLIGALRQTASSPTPIVLVVCPPSPGCLADPLLRHRLTSLERKLTSELASLRHVRIVAVPPQGGQAVDDAEGDRLGHIPYTPHYFATLALALARTAHVLKASPRKVIVLDCDNTLWKGVVGEDGVQGIEIGPRHRALQRFVLEKKGEGMLICLASKNVESDVADVFRERADMELRWEDLAATRVSWLPKSQNLQSLADELNVGLNSFVFIDDNPLECAEVEAGCPGVLAVCLPEPPAREDEPATAAFVAFLRALWPLDHLDVTEEDKRRTEMYQQNRERDRLQKSSGNLAAFLAGLELRVTISPPRPEQMARAAQLTQRTNQFNFSTRRRSEAELAQLLAEGHDVSIVEVSDRFGDYGIVGLLVAGPSGSGPDGGAGALEVDTFLLSCRVLGRGVEHEMMREAGRRAQARGLSSVSAPFRPTAKNDPALRFLATLPARRDDVESGAVYVLPADVAASFVYEPAENAAPTAQDDGGERAARPAVPVGEGLSERWNRFARELETPAKLEAALTRQARRARTAAGAAVPPRTPTERRLEAIWARVLRLPQVGITDDYFELGGTSLAAVTIFADIERELGRRLPLTTLVECPTIEQCALRVDGPDAGHSLVRLHEGGDAPPLFLVHDADGETLLYRNLARRLGGPRPIYALQPLGRHDTPVVHTRMEDMAAHYVSELRKVRPRGPYLLGGLCAGGIVAFEMARQLEAQGEETRLVAVFDAADVEAEPRPLLESKRQMASFTDALRAARPVELPRVIAAKMRGYLRYEVRSRVRRAYNKFAVATLRACLDRQLPLPSWARNLSVRSVYTYAESQYRPSHRVREEIVLFCATAGEGAEEPYRDIYIDPLLGWGRRSEKGAVAFEVPGGHGSMLQEPNVSVLADVLRARLDDAEREAAPRAGGPKLRALHGGRG